MTAATDESSGVYMETCGVSHVSKTSHTSSVHTVVEAFSFLSFVSVTDEKVVDARTISCDGVCRLNCGAFGVLKEIAVIKARGDLECMGNRSCGCTANTHQYDSVNVSFDESFKSKWQHHVITPLNTSLKTHNSQLRIAPAILMPVFTWICCIHELSTSLPERHAVHLESPKTSCIS
eukprot:3522842-Pyramimonas_sp.AAC.1